MKVLLSLVAGGAAGTLARFFLGGAVQRICGGNFPAGTFAVNMAGCFAAGMLIVLFDQKLNASQLLRTAAIAGFCGAFTTFSALIIESDALFRQGHFIKGFLNVLLSAAAGYMLFRLGGFLAQKFF